MNRRVVVVDEDDFAGEWAAVKVALVGLLVGVGVFEAVSVVLFLVGGEG